MSKNDPFDIAVKVCSTIIIGALLAVVGVVAIGFFMAWAMSRAWPERSDTFRVTAVPSFAPESFVDDEQSTIRVVAEEYITALPPTNLRLSRRGINSLQLDYTPSDPDESAPHYYRFELERATGKGRNSAYIHYETIDYVSESPAFFDYAIDDSWYRARGQRCTTNERTACGAWSDYSAPVKTPPSTPEPTGLRENLPSNEPHPLDVLTVYSLYQALEVYE